MTAAQAQDRISQLWQELRPLLHRTLGPAGTADWLAFAAAQEAIRARKISEGNVITLPRSEWTP